MLHEISDYSLLQSLHCYRACRCDRDYNRYSHYSHYTCNRDCIAKTTTRCYRDCIAKTTTTEHYPCLIGVGACALILIFCTSALM